MRTTLEKQRQRVVNAAKGNQILREMETIFAFIIGGNVSDTSAVIAEIVRGPCDSEQPSISTVSL